MRLPSLRTKENRSLIQAQDSSLAKRLPQAELIAAAVLGGAGFAITPELAYFTWAAGILLAINQIRTDVKSEQNFTRLDRLAETVDVSANCGVDQLKLVIDAYERIPEPEFQAVKDTVLTRTREELLRLATEKSSGELSTAAYYRWLLPMIDEAPPDATIKALSLMLQCEWDESQAERSFIDANRRAAERGVSIGRIFVMPRSLLLEACQNPAVRAHLKEEEPRHLMGYFVDVDWLKQHDAPLAAKLDDGFIAFDQRHVALIDLHSKDGSIRGFVTKLPAELAKVGDIHAELMIHAQELSHDLFDEKERALLVAC
jgi:hypothetical protein